MRSNTGSCCWQTKNNYRFCDHESARTVGDIESLPYIEAVRQMRWELGKTAWWSPYLVLICCRVSWKTKPDTAFGKNIARVGSSAGYYVCRTENIFRRTLKKKIALFCNVARPRSSNVSMPNRSMKFPAHAQGKTSMSRY